MVSWAPALSAVAGTAALILGGLLAARLARYRHSVDPLEGGGASSGTAAVPATNLDRYRPMPRLLSEEDLRFLKSRPGYTPAMASRFRRSQRRIFRMYLAELSGDFQELHAVARRIVADAPEQHAELVGVLMRQQLAFWRALMAIEIRLALDWAGFGPADARRLVEIVSQLQQTLAALPDSSAAPA